MPHDSNSPFLFRNDARENHEAERREERFEALMLQSWMLMRARAEPHVSENA
ncbi:MAG: hypothetical protein R3E14_02390 [Erythrobacter sp.]